MAVRGPGHATKRRVYVHHRRVEKPFHEARDAVEDRVDRRAVLLEIGAPLRSDLVDLAPARILRRLGVAEILEHGERGIHGAGARRIRAPKAVLELLDDL